MENLPGGKLAPVSPKAFKIEKGVKQGDALSTLVFNLILDYIVKDVDPSATIFTKSAQICGFADDLAILARNPTSLKEVFEALEAKAKFFGLKINEDKTKYLARLNTSRKAPDLIVGDYKFEIPGTTPQQNGRHEDSYPSTYTGRKQSILRPRKSIKKQALK